MDKQAMSNGFRRIKIDFALTLAGGELVRKDFSYDRQRNYYIREIFGDSVNMTAIIDYGKQYKLSSEYMFPNTPEKIKSRKFLVDAFAACVLLDRMNNIKSYTTAIDEYQMRYACTQGYQFPDNDVEDLFIHRVRDSHNQYTQQLTKLEYESFRDMMNKYADKFTPILKALEHTVMRTTSSESAPQKRREFVGFEKLKADFLFALAGSEAVRENFTYEQQVEYYIKAIYGNISDAETLIEYGKDNQRSAQYMFPNSPERIYKRKLLFQVFAKYTLLQQISLADSYSLATDRDNIRNACVNKYNFLDGDTKKFFEDELITLHTIYTQPFTEKNFESFKKLMKRFAAQFDFALETIMDRALNRQENPDPNTPFVKLCDRWGIQKKIRVPFKLKMDALLESRTDNNSEFVDYFDNIQHAWQDAFPKYSYCDHLEEYIRREKNVCIAAYDNKLDTIDEASLIDLLASVNIKLAIANGVNSLNALNEYLNHTAESLPNEDSRKIFNAGVEKFKPQYFPDNFKFYGDEIPNAVSPYKDGLDYINAVLLDELNFRETGEQTTPAQNPEPVDYDALIAQKDAEILALQKDLEYYENLDQRNFRNDILQYDKGLTEVIKKLCERKFGAPLNELYLMSAAKKEITPDNVKSVMQNFLFILNSLGVNPYEIAKLGKTIKFDSEEANIAYTVDETKLIDGINKGVVKYPGWKYKGEELVLPVIEV